jgi:hypothetical protein
LVLDRDGQCFGLADQYHQLPSTLRSKALAPLFVLAGLFGAMVAYWAWFVVGKKHANDADGK